MKGNKIADNRNNHEKNSQLNSQIRFGYSGIRTCILIFTIKSSHLFLFCIFVQTWMDYVSVCFCIGQATGKNSCQFFSSTKKKNYPYHKNSYRYQQTSTNSNGKKIQRKKKNRFKNVHFTIKVGRWQCWQTMHQFNYSVGPDIDDRLLMVLTKSIRINAVSAGIFTFSLLFS